jgi:hypothetical protein
MTTGMIRGLVPSSILPLAVLASGIAGAPWLRAFPADVMAVPLFGAAALSVLVPYVAVRVVSRRLWVTALIDLAGFVLYELLAVLREPGGLADLATGLIHGPAQVLTFALPLVSPRTLLVAPVALCWLAGAIAGECVARGWFTVLPHCAWVVVFGLAYAGSVRGGIDNAHDARVSDTLLAIALLAVLLILRAAQSWVHQDHSAETTQADGVLPLRGLAIGIATTIAVATFAAVTVQSSAFSGRTKAPQRVPSVNQSQPVSPVAFIAGLRPGDPSAAGKAAFRVTVDGSAPGYFGIADVDYYDGDGWTFNRSFRPSGGIVPADRDSALNVSRPPVTQHYRIAAGPLTTAPWMPYLYRPQRVSGAEVNIDAANGMIVPNVALRAGDTYSVRSDASSASFGSLTPPALPATSAPPIDTEIPGGLRAVLGKLVTSFADETGTPESPAVPFLQSLAKDLQRNYELAGPPSKTGEPTASASPPTASPSATSSTTPRARIGGVSFADVLASVIGPQRSATPEQYATLFALVARQLGVPARVVPGFRVRASDGATTLPAGSYDVTTADAWTWVEIPVRGAGWVIVDPSPSSYSDAQQQANAGAEPSPTPTTTPTQNALITTSNGGHAVAPKSSVPHSGAIGRSGLVIGIATAAAAVVLLLLLAPTLRRRVRARRRRRFPDPRRRLLGAWHESLDMLTESGMPELTHLTSAEIAAATEVQFGTETAFHAAYLGQAANTVVYSSTSAIGPAVADAAWRSHGTMRRLVRRELGVRGRLAAGLRYHRPKARRVTGPASWAAAIARDKDGSRSHWPQRGPRAH